MVILELLGQTTGASQLTSPGGLDSSDWIALASAIISILALLVTIYFARRTESASRSANDVAAGQAETQLRAAITASQQWVQQCNIQIATILRGRKAEELPPEDKSIYDVHVANYDSAVEQQLNSYEDACAKYLDQKIDTQRFEKTYSMEVRKLCEKESGTIHKLLHPRFASNYKVIWAVYEKWNDWETNPDR
jgi:type II secretory pathway pseudopilin PulG